MGNSVSKALLLSFEFLLASQGAAQYGLFSINLAVILIISNFVLIGLNYGVVRFLAIYQKYDQPGKITILIQSNILFVGMLSIAVSLIVVLFSDILALRLFGKPDLRTPLLIAGLIIPFEAENQLMSAIFRGLRKFKKHVLVSDFIRNFFLALSIPIILFFDYSIIKILITFLFGSVLGCLYGFYELRKDVFSPLKIRKLISMLKNNLSFTYLLFAWNIFQKTAGQGQTILAGIFLTEGEVGILSIFIRMTMILTFFQSGVNQSLLVEFSALDETNEGNRLKRIYRRSTEILLLLSIFITIPIAVNPGYILSFFGDIYLDYKWWVLPIIFAQVINVGTGPIGQVLISQGKHISIITSSILGSVVQIIMFVTLAPIMGLPGAVISKASSSILMTVTRHIFSKKLLDISFLNKMLIYMLLGGGLAILLGANLVNKYISQRDIYLLGSLISLAIFIVWVYLYAIINKGFKTRMMNIWRLFE